MGALPNLFVIGAGKAGTTSLHAYLGAHPEISMSRVKEPNYFVGADGNLEWRWGRVADRHEYEALFDASSEHRGESSTAYSEHPRIPRVPERIAAIVAEPRFVYLVRDPIERLRSSFQQRATAGPTGTFEAMIGDPDDPANEFVCASRYMTQVQRYVEVFGAESILVADQADLLGRRAETLAEIFAFLGVDPSFRSDDFDLIENRASDHRHYHAGFRRIAGSRVLRAVARPLPGSIRRRTVRGLRVSLSPAVARPEVTPELRESLVAALRPEVERLREFTGRGFETWSV